MNIRPNKELKRLVRLDVSEKPEIYEKPQTQNVYTRPRTLSPLNIKVRYVNHNKEALYNIKSKTQRPITESKWVKLMQRSPRNQIYQDAEMSNKSWRHEPDLDMSLSRIDFGVLKEDIMIKPSYNYCKTCYEATDYIKLSPRGMRSFSVPKKTTNN